MEKTFSQNHTVNSSLSKSSKLPYIVCALAGLFYLYEFVLQVSPSIMTSELMRDLKINGAGLGLMAAFYFYAYTIMQIPAGLFYDRYGPRLLITIALVICSAGAFFFGLTNNVAMASAGRFFMGVGSAFAFIGALVLVAHWFPPKHFALLAGVVQLMSSVGAIVGQAPVAKAIEVFGWRHVMMSMFGVGITIAIFVWLIVRDRPDGKTAAHAHANHVAEKGELKRLSKVCGKSQTWWIALYSFTSWAPVTAFAALWGVPYLVTAYNISTAAASSACSMIWIGIGIGSPLIGWWSNHIGKRILPLSTASVLGVIGLFSILYIQHLPMPLVYLALFLFGLAAAGQSLSFALVKDINSLNMVGTAIGFNNMAVVAGGALFQPLVGYLLQRNWSGESLDGAPVFQVADYQVAMVILPLCYLLGVIVCLWKVRETYCRSLHNEDHAASPTLTH